MLVVLRVKYAKEYLVINKVKSILCYYELVEQIKMSATVGIFFDEASSPVGIIDI